MTEVLITESIHSKGIELLKKNNIKLIKGESLTNNQLISLAKKASLKGIIVRNKIIPEELYNENLKIISKHGTGIDNINLSLANKKNIVVTNTPGVNSNAVAEHSLALILNISRRICYSQKELVQGNFEKARSELLGQEIEGKTLGVLGLGDIGSKIAQKCSSLKMKVLGYDPYINKKQAKKYGITLLTNKNKLIESSDYLSVNLPLNSKTENFIGIEEFKLMKKNSYLINTSRGGIVNEGDLIKALNENYIQGAAIDVFSKEPPDKDNPLLKMNNVIKTPHIGAQSKESMEKMAILSSKNLLKVLEGKQINNIVNPSVC